MGRIHEELLAMKSAGAFQQNYRMDRESRASIALSPGEGIMKGSLMKIANQKLLIPTNREMWANFMVELVRSKICSALSDDELKRIIQRARQALARKPAGPTEAEMNRDLPSCCNWDEHEVGNWFSEQGLECVKEAFVLNRITGKRLATIDANKLVKMGFRDLKQIREITAKIRELLGIPRPNIMRALMRIPPFETYLQRRNKTGIGAENLSFKQFCEDEGFPYDYLQYFGKNAQIPCTCEVTVYPEGRGPSLSESSSNVSESASSLSNVPTVECVARSALIHNKIVQRIIEDILDCLVGDPKCGYVGEIISRLMEEGFRELELTDSKRDTKSRLDFAAEVAQGLIEEMQRAAAILQDIEDTKKNIRENISPEQLSDMRMAASMFMEEVYPLAALMSLGEFTLESIFRQQPEFIQFVKNITNEAETEIDQVRPDAEQTIDEVLAEAERQVLEMAI